MKVVFRYFAGFFLTLLLQFNLFGQQKFYISPPSYENTYLFTIYKYNRNPILPKYIENGILEISQKHINKWTAKDSMFYAYKNVYMQKYDIALNNFSRLNMDTVSDPHAQTLYRTTLFKANRFNTLRGYNQVKLITDTDGFYTIKDAQHDLINAYTSHHRKKFIPESDTVFPIFYSEEIKTFNRNAPPNNNKLVEIAFAVDSIFRQFTVLHDGNDIVLSKAFEEMGDFQKEYFYITNANFYYTAALQFNKNNKSAIEKFNQSNREIEEKNYIMISFKNTFGKIIKNKYRLSDEYITTEIKGTANFTINDSDNDSAKRDYLPWLNFHVSIMIIIGLLLVIVLLFFKVEK